MAKEGKEKKDLLDLDDPLESGVVPVPTVQPPPRERQITYADDELTEQARLASVLIESIPPRASEDPRARLAPLGRIPMLAKSIDELGAHLKDPKIVFVLGFIDGVLPLETIIEVTGLPENETIGILDRLIGEGAIIFAPRR